ncbi:MAG: hypothetical protein U0414_10615 [Polyangiaceae bacterium]
MASLGPNVKLHLPERERASFNRVMTEVFGATVLTPSENTDIYVLEGTRVGVEVVSDAAALDPRDARTKGTWFEILVDDTAATRAALATRGLTPFPYADKIHDYFQLPGGQALRIAGRSG